MSPTSAASWTLASHTSAAAANRDSAVRPELVFGLVRSCRAVSSLFRAIAGVLPVRATGRVTPSKSRKLARAT
jgi:hypothetical protein